MTPMKLYSGAESGNSWKVRILLEQLEVPYEKVLVDLLKWEHKQPDFMRDLNPRGQVPVLEDDGRRFWDSAACMIYLARKMERVDWLPIEAAEIAEVMQWVSMAATEIHFGLQYGRRGMMRDRWVIGGSENKAQYQALGKMALSALEWRLRDHPWLALDRITIADIACFPYTLHAPQADLPLEGYPGVRAWLARCQAMPRWASPPQPPTRQYDDMPSVQP
jgi:glutathione S-transferase